MPLRANSDAGSGLGKPLVAGTHTSLAMRRRLIWLLRTISAMACQSAVSTHCRSCCRPGPWSKSNSIWLSPWLLRCLLLMDDEIAGQVPSRISYFPVFWPPIFIRDMPCERWFCAWLRRVVCSLCLAGLCRAGQRLVFSARCSDGCSDDLIFSCPIHRPLTL